MKMIDLKPDQQAGKLLRHHALWFFSLIFCITLKVHAEEVNPTPTPEKKIKDYSAAFAKFAKFYNSPDVNKARYVNLKVHHQGLIYIFDKIALRKLFKGNAWLLEDGEIIGRRRLLGNTGMKIEQQVDALGNCQK